MRQRMLAKRLDGAANFQKVNLWRSAIRRNVDQIWLPIVRVPVLSMAIPSDRPKASSVAPPFVSVAMVLVSMFMCIRHNSIPYSGSERQTPIGAISLVSQSRLILMHRLNHGMVPTRFWREPFVKRGHDQEG